MNYKRLFKEVKEADWYLFENQPDFEDKPFRPQKLSPSIGYKRNDITSEMLANPKLLYDFVYGTSHLG